MLKRAAIIIVLFALIGAAVNFPLAMWCAKSRIHSPAVPVTISVFGAEAAAYSWPDRGPHAQEWPVPTSYMEQRDFGYRHVHISHAEMDPSRGASVGTHSMEVDFVGWPLPCVRRVQMWWPWDDPIWKTTAEPDPRPSIHWAGAVGNPLILGLSVWILLVLPFELYRKIRSWRRHRRGACRACGYPAGAAAVCTECGAALPARVAAPA